MDRVKTAVERANAEANKNAASVFMLSAIIPATAGANAETTMAAPNTKDTVVACVLVPTKSWMRVTLGAC